MNREQASFLLGGIIFGLVAGLLMGFALFKPGAFGLPGTGAAPVTAEASTGGMDPGTRGSAQRGASGTPAGAPDGPMSGAGGTEPMAPVMQQIAALKAAIEKNPNDFEALSQLGGMYLQVSMFDRAAGYYERAVEVNPNSAEALAALAVCYINTGKPDQALARCREALRHDETYWPASVYAVAAAIELGDAKAAEAELVTLRRLNPGFEHLKEFESRVAQMKSAPKNG